MLKIVFHASSARRRVCFAEGATARKPNVLKSRFDLFNTLIINCNACKIGSPRNAEIVTNLHYSSYMRLKYLAFFVGLVFTTNAWAQYPSQSFAELNLGMAGLNSYTNIEFPGGSLLFGKTSQASDNFVLEFQVGAAFPSFATAKFGAGFGTLDKNVMVAVRPWPLALGPQVKRNNWTASLEFGTTDDSFEVGTIATMGYRMNLGKNEKASKSGAFAKSLKITTAASVAVLFVAGSIGIWDHI